MSVGFENPLNTASVSKAATSKLNIELESTTSHIINTASQNNMQDGLSNMPVTKVAVATTYVSPLTKEERAERDKTFATKASGTEFTIVKSDPKKASAYDKIGLVIGSLDEMIKNSLNIISPTGSSASDVAKNASNLTGITNASSAVALTISALRLSDTTLTDALTRT